MIEFSQIPQSTFWGKLLRVVLRIIPDNAKIFVLQGPLKGYKWIKGSGVNGYWLGTYEIENQREITKNIKKGFRIMDVGAHVGFYSLIFSKLAGKEGEVVSFEPSLRNLGFLKKHIAMNRIGNVKVLDLALSDSSGKSFLVEGASSFTNHLGESGRRVEVSTIDEWCEENNFTPNFIKIDVECFEMNVLRGGVKTIRKYKPVVAVAYNPDQHQEYLNFFKNVIYSTDFIKNFTNEIDWVIAKSL